MENKAYKVRIYPNMKQTEIIEKTFGCTRFLYNQMLAERIAVYEKLKDDKELLYAYKYKTEKEYKLDYEFLKEVPSRALQQARNDLDRAYKNFFNGIKKKKNVGYPKFKSKKKTKLSYRDPQVNGQIRIENNKLNMPKLGFLKVKGLPKEINGQIKSVTVSKSKSGKYFASILTECMLKERKRKSDNVIGIDLGLKEFAICSNGDIFSDIKKYNFIYDKKIRKMQKYLSRKTKGSVRYEKQRVKLNRVYEKRNDVLNNYFWNLVNKLCCENQAVAVENLNIHGMKKNRKLSHAIQMVNWGSFLNKLNQKAKEYGTEIYLIDRWFPSSKMCSICGNLKDDLKLSDRVYICDCGLNIDRDVNAAINIRNYYLKNKSLEYNDYKRGEVVRPVRLNFDNNGNFVEALSKEVEDSNIFL